MSDSTFTFTNSPAPALPAEGDMPSDRAESGAGGSGEDSDRTFVTIVSTRSATPAVPTRQAAEERAKAVDRSAALPNKVPALPAGGGASSRRQDYAGIRALGTTRWVWGAQHLRVP